MFYSRFPTYRVVFMQKLPISHVCLSPVIYVYVGVCNVAACPGMQHTAAN